MFRAIRVTSLVILAEVKVGVCFWKSERENTKKKHRVVEEQNETQETNDSALIFEYSCNLLNLLINYSKQLIHNFSLPRALLIVISPHTDSLTK